MLLHKEFYYIRHGQTDWNAKGLMQGFTDIPLNETGRKQAYEAAEAIKQVKIQTICASPLERALETAQILNKVLNCEIVIIDDLKEAGFGSQEGLVDNGWFEDWKDGVFTPEGAETRQKFIQRATNAVNEAINRPGPVLIAAHGGLYGAIKHHFDLPDYQPLPNCALCHHTPPNVNSPVWQRRFVRKRN
ncbi:histidine phosphatase family protein [Kiloniella sp. EL199]|uniref:histidine phosphatase family protein n=1 Tax=Kiloniella sp. EL199 TaxID=2107581 RepID=UPI000EA007DC|nr:histidine phosphatase family protein [Kiloniella sp. EL199]